MSLIAELDREAAYADHMAAMAQFWMRKAQEAERTIMILVQAAGGKIIVRLGDLKDANRLEMVRCEHAEDMTTHFLTRILAPLD